MEPLLTEQLKKLISDHSVRENLKSLLKQTQIINELASKLRKEIGKLEKEPEAFNQNQFLKHLEQLRVAKHYMRGIRFVNFYHALKGEEPRQTITKKFEAEKWLKYQAEKQAQWKERLEKEKLNQVDKEVS